MLTQNKVRGTRARSDRWTQQDGEPERAEIEVLGPEPETEQQPTIVALVPAHNEADVIADCLNSILAQTRVPDLVVVIADNCTDATADIAREFGGPVVVMETEDNDLRKVGALSQAWVRFGQDAPYVLGVDADTKLAPGCVEQLFKEMESNENAGGIMARYTFHQSEAKGLVANYLLRQQRMEFAGWTMDLLRRDGATYVLGGQATLFRGDTMRQVVKDLRRPAPWSTASEVEDMELTWRFNDLGWDTLCSHQARAYIGPMYTFKTIWAQRRKWGTGIIHLLRANGFRKHTSHPWRLQAKMLLDTSIRLLFVMLLTISLHRNSWVWSWIWIIPPLTASVLNFRIARRMPDRTVKDVVSAVLLVPGEIYLMFSIAVWLTCWANVLLGIQRDGWSAQYRAEGKA
jgi:cellulose synthase/poly-beta-1,6-N-acetylglucosamine synthase-like glycosyltransferase